MSLTAMVIVALNLTAGLMSAGWAILVLVDPGFRERAAGCLNQTFFLRLYVARAVPVGFSAGIGPMVARGGGVAAILIIAAAVQLLDVAVAIAEQRHSMMFGAAFAAIVHLACVSVVL